MSNLKKDAGEWLVILRKRAGLSQSQLARHIGAKFYTYVSQVETGRAKVHPTEYERWAEALRIDPKEFVLGLMRFYDPTAYAILFRGPTATTTQPQ